MEVVTIAPVRGQGHGRRSATEAAAPPNPDPPGSGGDPAPGRATPGPSRDRGAPRAASPAGLTDLLAFSDSADVTNEDLVLLYQTSHDVTVLDRLLQRNEGLIHHVLKRFPHASEPYEDLFQVARIGLIKAAQRFDVEKSANFATYAVAIADGEVRHHLRDALLLRQPRWARALYQRILDTQNEFYHTHHRSPSISDLAEAVNVREEGVLEIIRVYGAMDLHSLDEPFTDSGPVAALDRTLMRSVRQETFTLPIEDRIALYEALSVLSDAHKKILYLLFFKDLTQQEVAEELGMTQRTVSREQTKALTRLKIILNKKIL